MKDWNETLFGSKRSKKRISVICIAIIAGILLALLGMIAIDGSGRSTASQMVPTGLMKWENVLPADDARTEQAIQDDIMEKAVRIAYLEGQKAMLDSLDDAGRGSLLHTGSMTSRLFWAVTRQGMRKLPQRRSGHSPKGFRRQRFM